MGDDVLVWLASAATILIVVLYEAIQRWRHQDRPGVLARSAHAGLREDWFRSISDHVGSEIIAVQTLRNSMMTATLTATTATLGLMGSVTLAASQLHMTFAPGASPWAAMTPRLVMELLLMSALFTALACSTIAVRYFNHASFICAMPVGSQARQQWLPVGIAHVRQAGVLYSWGLRALLMVAPLVVSIVHPLLGPLASLGLVLVLFNMDRVHHHDDPSPLMPASGSRG